MKTCKKCCGPFPLDQFNVNRSKRDGLDDLCRPCHKQKNKESKARRSPEQIAIESANQKAWRAQNPDRVAVHREKGVPRNRARMRERYASDAEYRERVKEYAKSYREENPEQVKEAYRKWRDENAEYFRQYISRWLKTVPGRALAKRGRERHAVARKLLNIKYRAARAGVEGVLTNQDINLKFKAQKALCFYCDCKLDKKNWTIDHVVPISRGGSNWPENIVLACGPCNFSKSHRLFPTEWQPKAKNPA